MIIIKEEWAITLRVEAWKKLGEKKEGDLRTRNSQKLKYICTIYNKHKLLSVGVPLLFSSVEHWNLVFYSPSP